MYLLNNFTCQMYWLNLPVEFIGQIYWPEPAGLISRIYQPDLPVGFSSQIYCYRPDLLAGFTSRNYQYILLNLTSIYIYWLIILLLIDMVKVFAKFLNLFFNKNMSSESHNLRYFEFWNFEILIDYYALTFREKGTFCFGTSLIKKQI